MASLLSGKRQALLAIALLLFGAAISAQAAAPEHAHDAAQPCAVCQLAHLPAVQTALAAQPSAPGGVIAETVADPNPSALAGVPCCSSPRGPPSAVLS